MLVGTHIDLTGVSRDPDEVAKILNDPLTKPKATARLVKETLSALERTRSDAPVFTVPVLIIHGTADPITPPDGSIDFYTRIASPDKTLKLYDGRFHQPFIDTDRAEVFADLIQWIEKRM
jgi:alpha-beta hydrolase superfamily lysophospholipase